MNSCVICGRNHMRKTGLCVFCQYRVDNGMKAVKEINHLGHYTRRVVWLDGNAHPELGMYTTVSTEALEAYAETVKGFDGAVMAYKGTKEKPVFHWSYFKLTWLLAAEFCISEERATNMVSLIFPERASAIISPCYVAAKLEMGTTAKVCECCPIKWPGGHCYEGYGLIRKFEDERKWGQYDYAAQTAMSIFSLPLSEIGSKACYVDDITACTDENFPWKEVWSKWGE